MPTSFRRLLDSILPLATLLLITTAYPALAQGQGYWHTSGGRILDADGVEVRIAGVNWYGFETTGAVAHGLYAQDYKSILNTIKNNGYNTVRLPFSNQMVESPAIPSSVSYSNGSGTINTDLQGLNSLQIMDRIVSYAGRIGLRIILDNHRSEAGDGAEGSGLWYTGSYPESSWINDWTALASRYANNPTVIGMDLRNEPHNATNGGSCWDCGSSTNDWHLAAERAGNAILKVNPGLLIFIEGTDTYNNDWYWWGGNLDGVKNSPVSLDVANRVVYSAHDYGPTEYLQPWFNSSTTAASLDSVWTNHWAYITQNNIAPVWLGEFGTTNNNGDIQNSAAGSQGQWFQSMVQFLQAKGHLSWTYWALNGEDRYGLLDSNYDATPFNSLKQQQLATLQFTLGGGTPAGGNPPGSPSGLTATAASTSQINLAWSPSATGGVTYNVYSSTAAAFTASPSTLVASGLGSTTFQSTGLAASSTHYYVVTAVSNGVLSAQSNQASATTAAAPPPSGGSCHITYIDQNDWGVGFTGNISITNTGTALNGWTLIWTYSGNQTLNQSWNSNYSQNGQTVTLTNASWNASIAAGATLSGIGFNANYSGKNSIPTAFYINGKLCQ